MKKIKLRKDFRKMLGFLTTEKDENEKFCKFLLIFNKSLSETDFFQKSIVEIAIHFAILSKEENFKPFLKVFLKNLSKNRQNFKATQKEIVEKWNNFAYENDTEKLIV